MTLTVWYHDRTEVDFGTSWTGLARSLHGVPLRDITTCTDTAVTALYAYARPDAVVSENARPIISIEQTMMNPSGHNIPQRFSCLPIAADQGVAGIIYYPEFSRRTYSDPNPRYANPRVAMAQKRINALYPNSPPSLSLFWPTDPSTTLPDTSQQAQKNLADVVEELVVKRPSASVAPTLPHISHALQEMDRVIDTYGVRIKKNTSFRNAFPTPKAHWLTPAGYRVDPPGKAKFIPTSDLIARLQRSPGFTPAGLDRIQSLRTRDFSLYFLATLNSAGNDSEHPWPGYFSLLDMLYARTGPAKSDRIFNMVFSMPMSMHVYLQRLDRGLVFPRIIDGVADFIEFSDGIVAGGAAGAGPDRVLS